MRYAIVTNPVAGKMSVAQKRSLLAEPAVQTATPVRVLSRGVASIPVLKAAGV